MVKRYVLIDDDLTTSRDVKIEPGPQYNPAARAPPGRGGGLARDFPDELTKSVSIKNVESDALWGPGLGEAVVYACFVKQKIINIKTKDGTDAVSSLQIYLDGQPEIDDQSKITYKDASPPILKIQPIDDERGRPYGTIIFS